MAESTARREIIHEQARDDAPIPSTLGDAVTPGAYRFPAGKLSALQNGDRTPLVLIGCGSFNPPTLLHLRLFEMARDWARTNSTFEVVGGYLSPVGDAYEKAGLAAARDRAAMCREAAADSTWIDVDPWEALQAEYQRTVVVLDHFAREINEVQGGIEIPNGGARRPAHVALVAGADLVKTMSTPGVWSQEDLDKILSVYGVFIAERAGTDMTAALKSIEREGLQQQVHDIQNDVSSTTVRRLIKDGKSIRYVVPDAVINYVEKYKLYQ